MEQSKQILSTWREIALMVPVAVLLHGAAWCFWWGVEGRAMVVSSARTVAISSPSPGGHRYLANTQVLVNNAKTLVAETQPEAH